MAGFPIVSATAFVALHTLPDPSTPPLSRSGYASDSLTAWLNVSCTNREPPSSAATTLPYPSVAPVGSAVIRKFRLRSSRSPPQADGSIRPEPPHPASVPTTRPCVTLGRNGSRFIPDAMSGRGACLRDAGGPYEVCQSRCGRSIACAWIWDDRRRGCGRMVAGGVLGGDACLGEAQVQVRVLWCVSVAGLRTKITG